ncbi:hypothetical protein INR49_014613 [Caranx melampygus]|nr:hypothetical protein INR49_014613 [Caranx melampygus]
MESVRAVVYLSVCLSVLTSLCQGQRSADNQVPSALDEQVLGLTTRELAEALQVSWMKLTTGSVSLWRRKPASSHGVMLERGVR